MAKVHDEPHVNHTGSRGCPQVVEFASWVATVTWVRFPSPAPASRTQLSMVSRYPTPGSVTRYRGLAGSGSSFCRSALM